MDFQVKFQVNDKIFMRNPENSQIGRDIVKKGIDLINEIGLEQFTFKKLAVIADTTEATVYRYFQNKHKLLLYILNWYWSYMEFLMVFRLQNVTDVTKKLKTIIELFTHELPEHASDWDYNKKNLNQIVIAESSKVYLVKDVAEINKNEVFKPYKQLCAKIADVISEYNPDYQYPKSLSSTLIETAHHQQFFSSFLPKLTDSQPENKSEFTANFLENMLFKILGENPLQKNIKTKQNKNV